VIDVWPQKPQLVQDAVEALQGRCSHYLFISSIAVYRNYRQAGITEQHPLLEGSSYEPDNYSLNKVLCEKLVEKYFPGNFTIFRPGAIIGERDPGPFTHHLIRRFVTRGELLAPDAEDPVQVIDARDIGTFVNHCITKKRTGYYNLVGPARLLGYRSMLSQMAANLPGEVQIQWVDPSFLTQEMKVEPFVDIPFWIPIAKDPEPGFYQISHEKALAAGLRFSSFSDSVQRAYRSYQAGHTPSDGYLNGITAEREAELLSAWRKGR
jgi:2'-hydroxyisoflavone reductase